jgi:hypothetical protein
MSSVPAVRSGECIDASVSTEAPSGDVPSAEIECCPDQLLRFEHAKRIRYAGSPHTNVGCQRGQLGRVSPNALRVASAPALVDPHILVGGPAKSLQFLRESCERCWTNRGRIRKALWGFPTVGGNRHGRATPI